MSRLLSAMKVRKTPLPASWLKNAAPDPLPPPCPPCGCGAARRKAMPITRGNTAVTASSSRFRRRPKTSRSSEAKNLYIEALAGETDEQVLQARRGDREAADPDSGLDELSADPLGGGAAQHRRCLREALARPQAGCGRAVRGSSGCGRAVRGGSGGGRPVRGGGGGGRVY